MSGTKARYRNLTANGALPEGHEGRFARSMIFVIVAGMFALLGWAAVTPVNEITTGGGTIKTSALAEQVEHPDGGIVADILVSSGDSVVAGAPLLSFDTASLEREMQKLQAAQLSLKTEMRRIDFVLSGAGKIPDFASLADLSPEELLFWVEQSFLQAQLDLIDADSRAIQPTISMFMQRQKSQSKELAILSDKLARSRLGQQSGAIARNTVDATEREFLQLERSLLETRSEIVAQQSALDANELRKAELIARRNRDAALRRAEVLEQIVATEQSIEEIAARIDRATVRASVAGIVMQLTVSNPREVVAPGDLIAEIIPEEERLEAEIEVSADRIGTVEVGMPARLKVLSYDFTRYGEIEGHVQSISPSSYQDEQGNTVYRVTIELPNGGQSPTLANRPVRPGMTVTADILSDSKKVLSYLLKPLRALGDRAFTEA